MRNMSVSSIFAAEVNADQEFVEVEHDGRGGIAGIDFESGIERPLPSTSRAFMAASGRKAALSLAMTSLTFR